MALALEKMMLEELWVTKEEAEAQRDLDLTLTVMS